MQATQPHPVAQSFLVCREILQDRQTGEYLLIGPFTGIVQGTLPCALRLSLYVQLVGVRGTHQLKVSVHDETGRLVGECPAPEPIRHADPLTPCQICWRDLTVSLPLPGRYDLTLMANGKELAHHPLDVVLNETYFMAAPA